MTKKDDKTIEDLALILSTFRLDGERVIRISTGEETKGAINKTTGYVTVHAGSTKDGSRRRLYLHRVKFALHHRSLPEFVDHRDGDRTNNDIANLREVTRAQNAANSRNPKRPVSKTGHRGVYERLDGKFYWTVMLQRRVHRRGPFDTPEEAKEDREEYKKELTGPYYHRSKKVPVKIYVNAAKARTSKMASAKARTIVKTQRLTLKTKRKGMWLPSEETAAKAFLQELRLANPLFANASDDELRAIIDPMCRELCGVAHSRVRSSKPMTS